MNNRTLVALGMLTSAASGAAITQALHAEARPPAYVVGEIDITDPEGYAREFSPLARKALAQAPGYKALVLGGKTISLQGSAPKKRVIINVFDSLDAAVQAYSSPAFKEARKIGDKFATFRTYAVEGR
jgi:uncharacterized protein (DUF1330 family)